MKLFALESPILVFERSRSVRVRREPLAMSLVRFWKKAVLTWTLERLSF